MALNFRDQLVLTINFPNNKKLDSLVTLPGSKYLANRLLILAALSDSPSSFSDMPSNEDIEAAIKGLSALGAKFVRTGDRLVCTTGISKSFAGQCHINSKDSGSFSRFVAPILALSDTPVMLSGTSKMNSRPMDELFRALEQMGATIISKTHKPASTLPVEIMGPIRGGEVVLNGSTSSQFVSALLMVAGRLSEGLTIKLTTRPVSRPYIEMTLQLMKLFGIEVKSDREFRKFVIQPGQNYRGIDYNLESDPSSASYFLAAAAITAGHVCISNFYPQNSIQGEAQFIAVLGKMGCKIWQDQQGLHCQGPSQLKSVSVEMEDMPDVAQTLAVVAMFAKGQTQISRVKNLAYKESNRIEDTATEIRKTGIVVKTTEDSICIEGGTPAAATFDTHDDHRMAMSLALVALKTPNIRIRDPHVMAKSFPDYWQYLEQLGFILQYDDTIKITNQE